MYRVYQKDCLIFILLSAHRNNLLIVQLNHGIINTNTEREEMKKNKIKNGKWLYHLTSIDNLDSIIKNGLVSRKKLKILRSDFVDIADQWIIEKRVGFNLDDYIPFHFHPYSAFDVFVKNNNPKKEFIYITIMR